MMLTIEIVHWLASIIVLAEALNKLERTAPFAKGMTLHQRIVDGLKSLAWVLLAIGAGGGIAAPLLLVAGLPNPSNSVLHMDPPTLMDASVMLGFCVLIIRTRVKEG